MASSDLKLQMHLLLRCSKVFCASEEPLVIVDPNGHVRVCCVDLFTQGKLQRHHKPSNGSPRRGRPAFVYGVGDFSCITPTPPLTTVPYIGGEDDPAWGPRQTTGDDGLNRPCVKNLTA